MSPFNMSYQGLSAIDNGHHGYGHSDAHVCQTNQLQHWPNRS
jgi:hypothetical protein